MNRSTVTINKVIPMQGYDLDSNSNSSIDGYLVEYPDGHRTWMPQTTYDNYFKQQPEGIMTLGMATEEMKAGKKIARHGWNGKGMWLELQIPDANSKMTRPYIYMCAPKGSTQQFGETMQQIDRVPWTISQTDALATDYYVVDDSEHTGEDVE